MLQKVDYEDEFAAPQDDRSYLLSPSYYWAVLRRRWVWFFLPLVVVAAGGMGVVWLWPPTYYSEGRILVQSQMIPSELVRPTVTNAAQERIQVIEQRTMTRDNLVAIADKFRLFPDKRSLMTVAELVELIKKQTKITPVELALDFKQRSRGDNPTIVFSVGFEYSDAATASAVANELMTRILNEDLRDRTSRATDTTKFLTREAQRLQTENSVLDAKITQLRLAQGKPGASSNSDMPSSLSQLKAELIQKSALYADKHPAIQSLKRQIEALEKVAAQPVASNNASTAASLEALMAQQESLQKNLDVASAKLAAARLGENLERDQQSEKLEVIEQPSVPQEPIKPKRLKLSMTVLALAFGAGGGLTFLMELLDRSIRRPSDLLSSVDGRLIISIPYIVTAVEVQRRRRRVLLMIAIAFVFLVCACVAAYFFLPPIDLVIAKARVGLFR
jgi:uncharacterized protein involved in exopolysaccharide biosynthesis